MNLETVLILVFTVCIMVHPGIFPNTTTCSTKSSASFPGQGLPFKKAAKVLYQNFRYVLDIGRDLVLWQTSKLWRKLMQAKGTLRFVDPLDLITDLIC